MPEERVPDVGCFDVRIRVIEPNIFEVSVRATGTPEYEVVGITDIPDVDEDDSLND